MISLLGLDPATWRPHPLHAPDRVYTETTCWADVVIELVAAAGHPPEAMLGAAVEVDFELDQWTFFKPSTEALRRLHGIDVHEVQPVHGLAGLPEQLAERLGRGETLAPEVDAFHLPDTRATSYGREHVKTSIVVEAIDVPGERLRYFHNAAYAELSGADFRAVFGLDGQDPAVLPPYVELVRLHAGEPAEDPRVVALDLLRTHLERRPTSNPVARFAARLHDDLPGLLEADLDRYHAYAFATVRMAGSAFELLATHVRWLLGADGEGAARQLDDLVAGTKALSFRLARRRPFDVTGALEPMAEHWQGAVDDLQALVR